MLRRLVLSSVCGLVLAAGLVGPAAAGPGRASTPYVTASSPHSMTLRWSASGSASRYEVAVSRTKAGARKSSARTVRTHGRTRKLTVGGLGAGKAYCFTVRAVSGSSKGARSPVHCHLTMRRSNPKDAATVKVATFNVCSLAHGCDASWKKRLPAIAERILAADADVIALQETSRRTNDLRDALGPHGYVTEGGGSELVFYRTSRFTRATETRTVTTCDRERYSGAESTADWDRSARHYDEATARWYVWRNPFWYTEEEICHEETVQQALGSGVGVGQCPFLIDRTTNERTAFCTIHMTAGTSAKASRTRRAETRQMIRWLTRMDAGHRVVLAGDFNSDRGRPDDAPRKELAKVGWYDAYDRSSSYTRPWLNSFNGYRTVPKRSLTWGGHIDRVFVRPSMGVSDWRVEAHLRHGRYAGVKPSDHNLVRVTVHLP